MDIDQLKSNLCHVHLEGEFSPFLARKLGVKMGLKGKSLIAVSAIVEKMYQLFSSKNLDLIEINPLAIDSQGNLMALDGRISLSDRLILSSSDMLLLSNEGNQFNSSKSTSSRNNQEFSEQNNSINWLDWQEDRGQIAILGDDEAAVLVCWDLIKQEQGKPNHGVIIDLDSLDLVSQSFQEQIKEVFWQLQAKGAEVILLNFWSEESTTLYLAHAIHNCCQAPWRNNHNVPLITENNGEIVKDIYSQAKFNLPELCLSTKLKFVIRLPSSNLDQYKQEFAHPQISWTSDLTEAIEIALSLSKTK